MNSKRLRACILGAGYISSFHKQAISRLDDVELVAVCDLNISAADALASQTPKAKAYSDYSRMLKDESVDVVHILTQPDSHFPLARMAIEAGCHVVIEKPVTTSLAEAIQLNEISQVLGKSIAINHNFLFSRPFEKLRRSLKTGKLGPLKSVRIVWKKSLAQQKTGPWNLWMLRSPENLWFETGSHTVSELLAVIDEIPTLQHVYASKPKILPSGVSFYRRWRAFGQANSVAIELQIDCDNGYQQHFVEVEGLFGVARADIEADIYIEELPTGRTYDSERLSTNLRAGTSRARQAIATYVSFAASKFTERATGTPYETSMLNGILNCYDQLSSKSTTRFSSIEFGLDIAKCIEEITTNATYPENACRTETLDAPAVAPKPEAKSKVLIIGATGFIGRELMIALEASGIGVRALVRNPSNLVGITLNIDSEIIVGDFRDKELMETALKGIDTVFHLAVAHGKSLSEYLNLDTNPTIEFARLCQKSGVKRFIYTGTIDSLNLANSVRIREADGLDPDIKRRNNYAHSKAIAEKRLLDMHATVGFPVVIVRPAIVLGPGGAVEHPGVANWHGLGHCEFWGRGENLLPIVLVEDVVKGLVLAMRAPAIEGKTFNLSAEPCISAKDYVAQVESELGARISTRPSSAISSFAVDAVKWSIKLLARHPDRHRIPSLHDWRCREQHAAFDTTAARQELGWDPIDDREIIIERGIRAPARQLLLG